MPASSPKPFALYSLGPNRTGAPSTKVIGPGEPPPGFVSATTSASEWVWYWASAKVYNDPPDPRQQPYFGGQDWGYQIGEDAKKSGIGAVVDFVYYTPGDTIGVRIQTDRYHEATTPQQKAFDLAQRNALARWLTLQDVYEQDFIQDRTGEAACRLVVQTLGGRKNISPGRAGTRRRPRLYQI